MGIPPQLCLAGSGQVWTSLGTGIFGGFPGPKQWLVLIWRKLKGFVLLLAEGFPDGAWLLLLWPILCEAGLL